MGSTFSGCLADMASARRVGFWQGLQDACGLRKRSVGVTQVEVTSICPNRCAYCPRTTCEAHWKSRHMLPKTFARLWPLFQESVRVHLQGWGEPLLHPDFLDMVAFARAAGCSVSTTTSGLHMTRDLAEAMVESGLDVIAFSLAGTTAESNDSLRAGTPFERVLESIQVLQEVRKERGGVHLEIHIAYLLLASRIGDIGLLPELMKELGVHATVVSTLDGNLVPEWRGECYGLEEREKVLEARRELEAAAAQARSQGLDFHFSLPQPEPTGRCFEDAEHSVFIDAEGNLAPCVHLNLPTILDDQRRRVFGSCLSGDPIAVWNSEPFASFRAALAAGDPDIPCQKCQKRFTSGNNP